MRRILLPLLAVLAVAALADLALWLWAERQLQAGLDSFIADRHAAGWTADAGTPVRGGWPLAAELTVPQAALAGIDPALPVRLAWRADRLVLSVALLHPRTLRLSPKGAQQVRLDNGPEIAIGAEALYVTVPLNPDRPSDNAALTGRQVRFGVPGGGDAVVALLNGHVGWNQATGGDQTVSLTGEEIELPPGRTWPLGPRIASVAIDAVLLGNRGELRRLALGWGPLGLSAHGTLGLDAVGQPEGSAQVRLVGFDAALDTLADNHAISTRGATAAKAVLGLMAHSPEGGGAPEVEVPLDLHQRTLSMGDIPLAKFAPVSWGTAQHP